MAGIGHRGHGPDRGIAALRARAARPGVGRGASGARPCFPHSARPPAWFPWRVRPLAASERRGDVDLLTRSGIMRPKRDPGGGGGERIRPASATAGMALIEALPRSELAPRAPASARVHQAPGHVFPHSAAGVVSVACPSVGGIGAARRCRSPHPFRIMRPKRDPGGGGALVSIKAGIVGEEPRCRWRRPLLPFTPIGQSVLGHIDRRWLPHLVQANGFHSCRRRRQIVVSSGTGSRPRVDGDKPPHRRRIVNCLFVAVSARVGNVKNNDPSLIGPIAIGLD